MPRKQHESGFVYIWRDRKHKRYYVGSHWGSETDGYVCSSTWMRNAYRVRPHDFKRRIISKVTTSKYELHEEEHRWLQMIKSDELKVRYYNQHRTAKDHWMKYPEKAVTVAERISHTTKGKVILITNGTDERRVAPDFEIPVGWRRGQKPRNRKPTSEETKRKIGDANRGRAGHPQSAETRAKIAEKMTGREISDEMRAKCALIHKGKKRTEEAKRRMSEAHARRTR